MKEHRVYAVCTVDADSTRDAREVAKHSEQNWHVCGPPTAAHWARNVAVAAISAPAGILIGGLVASA